MQPANRTGACWRGPPTERTVPFLTGYELSIEQGPRHLHLRRGGYVLADSGRRLEVILIATGSEVALALSAHAQLTADGIGSRVVSMPCWELFDRQSQRYREDVLPPPVQREFGFTTEHIVTVAKAVIKRCTTRVADLRRALARAAVRATLSRLRRGA